MTDGRKKIVSGLEDAAAFARGEDVGARVTQYPAKSLVDRLIHYDHDFHVPPALLLEAAAEIERLNSALEEIACGLSVRNPFHIANEALGRASTE